MEWSEATDERKTRKKTCNAQATATMPFGNVYEEKSVYRNGTKQRTPEVESRNEKDETK